MKLSHCRVIKWGLRVSKIDHKCYIVTPKAIIPVNWDVVGLQDGYSVFINHSDVKVFDDIAYIELERHDYWFVAKVNYKTDKEPFISDWVQVSDKTYVLVPVNSSEYTVPASEYKAIIEKFITEPYVKRLCKAVLGITKLDLDHIFLRRNGGGILINIGGIIFAG